MKSWNSPSTSKRAPQAQAKFLFLLLILYIILLK